MHKLLLATCSLLFLVAGNSMAANCPSPSSITQEEDGQGFAYAASGGWKGDNPMANKDDLASFTLVNAKITGNSVICRYEGKNEGGTSLSLPGAKRAVGGGWNNGECSPSDVNVCTFE